jgi:hypothetical protein
MSRGMWIVITRRTRYHVSFFSKPSFVPPSDSKLLSYRSQPGMPPQPGIFPLSYPSSHKAARHGDISDMNIPYHQHHHHSTIAGPSSRTHGVFQRIYSSLPQSRLIASVSEQEVLSMTERKRSDGEKSLESWEKR